MDIRKIKKLIELLEESGIAEIEIKEGEESLRISRMAPRAAPQPVAALAPVAPAVGVSAAPPAPGGAGGGGPRPPACPGTGLPPAGGRAGGARPGQSRRRRADRDGPDG